MLPLDEALQSWTGPGGILTTLQENGYNIHSVYRNCVVQFCKSRCFPTDIEIYWEESAREYISSAGADFDLGKKRRMKGYYRSAYLEQLVSRSNNISSKFDNLPSVHPCIHGYKSEIEFADPSVYSRIRSIISAEKALECVRHSIDSYGWTGYKRELNLLIDDVSNIKGFDILDVKKNRMELQTIIYGLKCSNGLIFYFHADNGVYEPLVPRLPIEFRIGYKKIRKDDFFISDFRYIIPGFEQYAYYDTSESAVLGVYALIHAFRALAQSFA